ncbi:MAG: STAS domain-containing protein [Desulfobacterales bacterium]|nr:STAS domain-containing protein [Desulfobacterales bacterium]
MPGFANRLQLARDRLAETHPMDAFADLGGFCCDESRCHPANSQGLQHRPIRRSGEDAVILDIRGALTASSKEAFAKAFGEAAPKAKRVLMNLSGLLNLDIQGVGLLVVEITKARRRHIDIMACGLSGRLRDILESFRPRRNHDAL